MATTSSTSSVSSSLNISSLGGASAPLQITGLASGLDTNTIIQELMSIERQPVTNLQNQQTGLQTLNSNLTSIQTALQGLVSNARALSATTLFSNTQTVTSSNSAAVAATPQSKVGAVVGGYQVTVSALASSYQATYSFAAQQSTPDTVTFTDQSGNQKSYSLAAGASAQDLVNAVNADRSGTVWGTVVNGNIVFSDRSTGAAASFTVSDTAGALPSSPIASTAGQDAQYAINGVAQPSSATNTIANAIPGVSLTLAGLTSAASGPVIVNVGAPSVSTSAIQTAVQNFISSYNSVISQITTQLSQTPSSSDPTRGTLYEDSDLNDLLASMRQAMYTSGSGLPAGMASMLDLGVSTGAASGNGAPSQSAISGQLSLNVDTLTQAIANNPSGTLDARLQGDNSQISDLSNRINSMQSALNDKQAQLQQQFAALEAALSQNQSTSSWLSSQLASLSG
jgi:flagellar hook-associated protein 2